MRRLNAESRNTLSRNTRNATRAISSDPADASRISRPSRCSFCSVEKSIYRSRVCSWRGESISQRDVGKRDVDVARESDRERSWTARGCGLQKAPRGRK